MRTELILGSLKEKELCSADYIYAILGPLGATCGSWVEKHWVCIHLWSCWCHSCL